jgi:alpha-N-arabinofuranosidase
VNGYRKQAVDWLKELGIPVLRWPGGCFADDYHWRDGIGPLQKRPKTVNIWWGQYTEDNSFGTHEFIGLCKLIGAEPYLAGNVGSGTPRELRDWMEYCNFRGGSTLSDARAANGSPEPFGVKYWGVGNENWGCGGRMTAEEYATLYRRYGNFLLPRGGIGDMKAYLIACGPSRNDVEWTRRFFENMPARSLSMVHGYAMHFYSNGRLRATEFTPDAMKEQLATFATLEKGILQQHALLRGFDPAGNIGLLIDEWGVWDRIPAEDEKRYGKLFQQIPMRSAVAAALGLNIFHRQADKLVMCNIAQIVNVLHSLILTDGPQCVRTSTYYAYELLKPHRNKTAVHIENPDKDSLALSVSASRQNGQMVLTFVNPLHDESMEVECAITGVSPKRAAGRILHHADLNACNTFENPDTIVPKPHAVTASAGGIKLTLPPLSIVTAEAEA